MFTARLDAGGSPEHLIVAVAGFVAPDCAWDEFSQKWNITCVPCPPGAVRNRNAGDAARSFHASSNGYEFPRSIRRQRAQRLFASMFQDE